MKSLVLKDLYNITHNMKSLVLILVFLAFAFIPTADVLGFVFAAATICSMMVVTTFSFDEACGWDAYALVMPVGRRTLVAAKYAVLFLFTGFGVLVGLVMGTIGGAVTGKMPLTWASFAETAAFSLQALGLGMIIGGMNIPLVIRFGPERGRLMLLISALVPAGIAGLGWMALSALGANGETVQLALLLASPLLVLAWDYLWFRISCRIYDKKEF